MTTVIVGEVKTAFGGSGQGPDSQLQFEQQHQQLLSYHRSGTPLDDLSEPSHVAFHHKSSSYIGTESYIGTGPISQITESGYQTIEYTPLENDLDVRFYQAHYNDSSEHLLEPDQLATPNTHSQEAFSASDLHQYDHSITEATGATTTTTIKTALNYSELGETGAHLHVIRAGEDHKTYHLLESDQQISESHGRHQDHDYHDHHSQQQHQQHYQPDRMVTPVLAMAQHYELPSPNYYVHQPYNGSSGVAPMASHIAYDPHQYQLVDPNFAALGYDQPIVSEQYDPSAEFDSCLQQFSENPNEDCNQQDEDEQLEREGSGSSTFIESCFNGGEYCANRMDDTSWDHQYNNQQIQDQHEMINLDEHQIQQQSQRPHLEQEAQPISLLSSNQNSRRDIRREILKLDSGGGQASKYGAVSEKNVVLGCRRETLERLRAFIENRRRIKAGPSSSGYESACDESQIGAQNQKGSRAAARRQSIFELARPSWQSQSQPQTYRPYEVRSKSIRELDGASRVTNQFEHNDKQGRPLSPGQRQASLGGSRKYNLIDQQDPSSSHIAADRVIREPALLNMLKGSETQRHPDQYWSDQNHTQKSDHDRSWAPRAIQIINELEDTGVQTRATKRRRLQQQLEQQQKEQSNPEKRLSSIGPSSSSCGSYSSIEMMTEEDEIGGMTNSPSE